MQLTCVLNAMKRQLFPGHMHRGKYRYVRPVKLKEMNLLRAEFERSERVMKLLINPYLTQKESSGHSLALEKVKKSKERVIEARRVMKLKENVYIEDRLKHLTVRDSWDI